MLKVNAPEKNDYVPTIYDDKQFKRLLNVVSGTAFGIPILLAGMLGLRRGKALGLRW